MAVVELVIDVPISKECSSVSDRQSVSQEKIGKVGLAILVRVVCYVLEKQFDSSLPSCSCVQVGFGECGVQCLGIKLHALTGHLQFPELHFTFCN